MSAQTFANSTAQFDALMSAVEGIRTDLLAHHDHNRAEFEEVKGDIREIKQELQELKTTRKSAPTAAPKASSPKKSVVFQSPYRFPFPGQILEGCCQAIAVNSNLFSQCPKPAVEGCDGFCRACFTKSNSDEFLGHIQDRVNDPDWEHPKGKKIKTAQQYLNSKTGDRITIDEYRIEAEKYYGSFGVEYEITGKELEVPKAGRPKKNSPSRSPAPEEDAAPESPKKGPGRPPKPEPEIVLGEEEVEVITWPTPSKKHKVQLMSNFDKMKPKFDEVFGPGAADKVHTASKAAEEKAAKKAAEEEAANNAAQEEVVDDDDELALFNDNDDDMDDDDDDENED